MLIPYKQINDPSVKGSYFDHEVEGEMRRRNVDLNTSRPKDHVLVDIRPANNGPTITAYVHKDIAPEG